MGSPLGVIFIAVLGALAGSRAVGAIARTRVRWVRYLRACPPSRLSELPSQMITGAQRRRLRSRQRAERLALARPVLPAAPEPVPVAEPEWDAPIVPRQPLVPVQALSEQEPTSDLPSQMPAEAGRPAGAAAAPAQQAPVHVTPDPAPDPNPKPERNLEPEPEPEPESPPQPSPAPEPPVVAAQPVIPMEPAEPTLPEPVAIGRAELPTHSPFSDATTIALDNELEPPVPDPRAPVGELPTEPVMTDQPDPVAAVATSAAQEVAPPTATAEPPEPASEPAPSRPAATAPAYAPVAVTQRSSTFPRPSPAYTLPKMGEVRIGLIGGSGLGEALASRSDSEGRWHELETPFGTPSGPIFETNWSGLPVFFLSRHGPGHLLNPTAVPYRANVFALKQLGVTHVIASGAVGSLRDHLRPRDLVIADQVIDKTLRRAGTFYERAAVHVEFAEPFCPVLRRILLEAGRLLEERGEVGSGDVGSEQPATSPPPTPNSLFHVHDRACYVCMEGPAFSTRAESLMHRLWGGDLIGMTAMPEAKLAREAEMSYALVSLVTDYDSWRRPGAPQGPGQGQQEPPAPSTDPAVLLKEIIANLQAATDNGIRLIRRAVSLMADRRDELLAAPAQQALKLAIWSDKSRIPREDVELLGPLWMRYFEKQ